MTDALRRSPLPPLLETVAVVLLGAQVTLRLLIAGGIDPGLDYLLGALVWMGAGVYFLARALGGDGTMRFSGLELPLLGLVFLALMSVLDASYRWSAQQLAFAWVTHALLLIVLTDLVHRRGAGFLVTVLSATGLVILIYAVIQHLALLQWMVDNLKLPERVHGRARTLDPFGTFVQSNALAGFIAIVLPVVVGSVIDARTLAGRRPYWMSPNAVLRGLWVVLAVVVLNTAKSRGGSVAAVAGLTALGVFGVARVRGISRGRLALGAVALAGVAALALAAGGWNALKQTRTFRYRAEAYWPAAVLMIQEAPWSGKGLANYEEHYTRLKGDFQTEVRDAHNDYLQVAAEIGIPGAVLFGLVWILTLWRAAAGVSPPPLASEAPLALGSLAAGFVGVAGAMLLKGTFYGDFGWGYAMGAGMLACWLTYAWFTSKAAEAMDVQPGPGVVCGAMAGIAAYLVHAAVDFDFYSLQLNELLFVMAAIVLARGARLGFLPFPPAAGMILAVGSCLVALGVAVGLVQPLQNAEELRKAAGSGLAKARTLEASDPLRRDEYERISRLLWQRAAPEQERLEGRVPPGAYDLDRNNAETLQLIAEVYYDRWSSLAALVTGPEQSSELENKGFYEEAEMALLILLQGEPVGVNMSRPPIRPAWAGAWFSWAKMSYRRYEYFQRIGATGMRQGMRNSALYRARDCLKEAVKLYPSLASHRAWLAHVLHLMGDREGARREAAEALRLDALVETEHQPDLNLVPEEQRWIDEIPK